MRDSLSADDSFSPREKAQEEFYVKQREAERLQSLREKPREVRKGHASLEEDVMELEEQLATDET
ncbi:hypothetical protein [Streptomyces exfoliatus]|uniref:hypothetical protein n=1 Tax=Streptomyces exfoliatus TaxID=1905 RepID=UPI00324AE861